MYNVTYFKEKDLAVIKQFMHDNPFVILCGSDTNRQPIATQVPVLVQEREDKLFLQGHIMRKTDHHLAFEKNADVLAIFTGPHAYVSASWYSNPENVSTWNYMAVYAKGKLQFLNEPALLDIISRTTLHFENNENSPTLVEKLPKEYLQKMMNAIIAFEIEVTHLDNVFKLSQNRDEKSYENIIGHLQEGDEVSGRVAAEMKKRGSQLFDGKK